jgi:hypothetical protein
MRASQFMRERRERRAIIENSLQIKANIYCAACLRERPDCITPQKWSRLDVGWTEHGLQVWCRRHDCNVLQIDLTPRAISVESAG